MHYKVAQTGCVTFKISSPVHNFEQNMDAGCQAGNRTRVHDKSKKKIVSTVEQISMISWKGSRKLAIDVWRFPPKNAFWQWWLVPPPFLNAIMQRVCRSNHERSTLLFKSGTCIDLSERKVLSNGELLNVYEKFLRCNLQSNQAARTASDSLQTFSVGMSDLREWKEQSASMLNSR